MSVLRRFIFVAVLVASLLFGNVAHPTSAVLASSEGECTSNNIPTVTLHNGVEMPLLAMGTAHLITEEGLLPEIQRFTGMIPERLCRSLNLAFENNLLAVDTALIYRSQTQIRHVLGNWFGSGKLQRKDVFIGSKIYHGPVVDDENDKTPKKIVTTSAHMPDLNELSVEQVTERVREHFEQCLVELGVGYVDLMLLHWPAVFHSKHPLNHARRLAAWQVLEDYYERGWARAIGVSNFSEHHIEQLMKDGATIKPMVNQIEASVYLQHDDIVAYCQQHNIQLQAYSPFGRGLLDIHKDPVVVEISKKHRKDTGQIGLRYLIQKGYAVTFLSNSESRIKTNQEIFFDFELDEDDMKRLTALNRPDGTWGLPSPYDMT